MMNTIHYLQYFSLKKIDAWFKFIFDEDTYQKDLLESFAKIIYSNSN